MNEPHTTSSDGDKAEQGRQQSPAAERNVQSGGPVNAEAGAAGGQQADTLGAAAAETNPAAAAAARAADARASTTAAPAGRGAPSARTGGKANPRKWTPKELETLVELHARNGNKWATIARALRRRSDNDCKNIFHTALRFTQRHEHEAEDSARLRAKTETSTLLRAYAQAVGPNCNDPQVRQRGLEAARQQQAQEDLEEAEVAAARAGVAGSVGSAGQQAAAGGGAAASAGSPLSASGASGASVAAAAASAIGTPAADEQQQVSQAGTVSPRASAGAASSSRLPSSAAGGGGGPGSAAAASQSVDVVGVDSAVATGLRQAAQRAPPPWTEHVDGPPHGPPAGARVTALLGMSGVDRGPGQQARAAAAEETRRPSGTEAVSSGPGGPAARQPEEASAPPCEGGHAAAGGGSIPEPWPTAAEAGGGGPLASQTTAGLEQLGTVAAALLLPPPSTATAAAAASAQAGQEAVAVPLWPHGLQGLAGPPQPRPLSSPLPLMHAWGPPAAPPPFPAAAEVLQEPWSEGVSTVTASSSLPPASAPGYAGPLDEALSLLLEPLPPPPEGAGGGGRSSSGSLGSGQRVPAGGGRMHSAGWLASGVWSGPPGPLAAGPHGASGAHASSFDPRWQQAPRSLLAPAATALAPADLSSEQASYAAALMPPPPPVPHGGPPPWAVPSQRPAAPPALLPPVEAAAEAAPWDSPWSASHAAGLVLHGGPPAPPLQRPRLAHPPYPQHPQYPQLAPHPQQAQQQAQHPQQALQPLCALADGGILPPPPPPPPQQEQQQMHLYTQLGVPLLPQLGAQLQMQQVQVQPTTMWAVGGSVGSSGAWASGPPSAGTAGRGDLDLSSPLQLAAPQGQQQRPHTLPQQPPWLTDLEPSIEEIWYNMLSEN